MLSSLFVEAGPASAGWTIYPPLSALPQAIPGSGAGMTLWLVSMALFIAASLMGSLNYIVTVINLRTKGMTMTRLPLTIWAFFVTAIIGVVSFPVLLSAALLLIFDRSFGTSFFLSDIYIAGEVLHYQGGSPVLFEHLFWFLGHPEVYIVILPALGITSEIIATNSRKPIFGYRAMIMSILAIAFLSTIVWGHHMFISGMNPFLGSVFTFTTLLIAIPSAVKAFNYITTLWKGNLQMNPAMLFSIGLVSTFITGGLTGIILGDSTLDINVHDTYFVVAHFHLVMGISALYGMFAGIYHWFPKMFGRMLNKNLGYVHFWVTAVCAYGVFFPMHFIGLAGLPRRYYTNTNFPLFDDLQNVNVLITTFALIGGVFQLVFLYNFFSSIFYGKKAVQNPWKSNTLEWTTPVEHIHGNWPEKFQKCTVGLMTIAIQVTMRISFAKRANERRRSGIASLIPFKNISKCLSFPKGSFLFAHNFVIFVTSNENLDPTNKGYNPEELDLEKRLRPLSFDDFAGQDQILENLKVFVQAANQRNEALRSCSFSRASRFGKDYLGQHFGQRIASGN